MLRYLLCPPSAIRQSKPSFNPADTNALVAAVGFGKGLSKCRPPGPVAPGHPGQGGMMTGGPTLQQVTIGGQGQAGMGGPTAQQQGQPGMQTRLDVALYDEMYFDNGNKGMFCLFVCLFQPGKMPSSIKTNIKSASGSMHPYNRRGSSRWTKIIF